MQRHHGAVHLLAWSCGASVRSLCCEFPQQCAVWSFFMLDCRLGPNSACVYLQPGHYGLFSGYGCIECGCHLASSGRCDPLTGQCSCHAGVEGQLCDRCAEGHYNYTQNGCLSMWLMQLDCRKLGSCWVSGFIIHQIILWSSSWSEGIWFLLSRMRSFQTRAF